MDAFLSNYKRSVQFAGLLDAQDDKKLDEERQSAETGGLKIGDFVQWEHSGVLGFPKALKLVKFSDDGAFAWVEGHTTGLPTSELVKVDAPPSAPTSSPQAQQRTGLPHDQSPEDKTIPHKGVGMRREVFSLTEGDVTIQWPERISKESLQDFNDWLAILQRKIRRSVITPDVTPPSTGGEDRESE